MDDTQLTNAYTSRLGTWDYWNESYQQEINQFHNNNKLLGDIWYGKPLQKKILSYICAHFTDKATTILDIGFGNGVLLYQLSKNNFTNWYGIDYSPESIEWTTQIIKCKEAKHRKEFVVHLYQEDINCKSEQIKMKFDVIHDKGGMDAYLWNPNNSLENYISYVLSYCKINTVFILSSCNSSTEEVWKMFSIEKGFERFDEIKSKTIVFGGKEGAASTTQIFRIVKIN